MRCDSSPIPFVTILFLYTTLPLISINYIIRMSYKEYGFATEIFSAFLWSRWGFLFFPRNSFDEEKKRRRGGGERHVTSRVEEREKAERSTNNCDEAVVTCLLDVKS